MSRTLFPQARHDDLVVQAAADELLVFDRRTDKAYVLNPTAAAVWRAANGTRTVQEIADYLSRETPISEQTVWYALGQMQELLVEPVRLPQTLQGISRRQFLQRAGLVAGAVAIPVVVSFVAPPPAHAQSATGIRCCRYNCDTGPMLECISVGFPSCPSETDCTFVEDYIRSECSQC